MKNKSLSKLGLISVIMIFSAAGYAQKETSDNKVLVQRWFTRLADQDTVALGNMYADSALIESPNWEGTKKGPAAIREIYSRYFATSPDLVHKMTNIFVNEDAVVIEFTFSGTMTNPEKNSPDYMRGKKYTLRACSRMNIQQGKITAQSYYFDQVAFLRQVGFFDQH